MGFKKDKREILSLLSNHKQLIFKQTMRTIPSNYAQIQQAAIVNELDDEIEKLFAVFSEQDASQESMKSSFQTLCKQRDRQNQGTCLSYTALPEGVCNRLYIDIATILFKPKQLDEMLYLLMPGINNVLIPEVSEFLLDHKDVDKLEARVQINLQSKALDALSSYQFNSSLLSEFIRHDNVIFMVEKIAKLPLFFHHNVYKLLSTSYPELSAKLYKHNDDLKQLFFDIELIEKNGKTPHELLTHFAKELIRSGSRYTGNQYAAEAVIQACLQFRSYLDQLPQQFRDDILALQAASQNLSLLSVLDNLAKGNCVETAAAQIKLIQENQRNQAVLIKVPNATEEQLKLVKKKYRKPLAIRGYDDTKNLPEALRKELLKQVKINSTNDYIDLFLNLPPSEYSIFLTHAQITCYPALPDSLGATLEMLDAEQQLAFLSAVMNLQQKFGGLQAILKLFINIKLTADLKALLTEIPSQKLVKIIKNNNLYGHALLHKAASADHIDILQFFLKNLSEDERLTALQEKGKDGINPLQYAAHNNNPELFRLLWDSVSEKNRSILVNAKAYNGSNLLDFAAQKSHAEIWRLVWNFHSRQVQRITLLKKTQANYSLLDWALKNPNLDVLRSILEPLSDKERLAVVLTKGKDGIVHLHYAINHNSKAFFLIWELLTEENRLIAANEKNSFGSNMLHVAAQLSDSDVWQFIWTFYSEQERFNAIAEKNTNDNYTLLYCASMNPKPDAFRAILEFLPENDQLTALLEKTKDGLSPLFWLVKRGNHVTFASIWSYLSKANQLKLMQEKHNDENLLHFALNCSPAILDILLQAIPEQERRLAAREKGTKRGTWLNKAAQYIDYKAAITMWQSLTEQDHLELMQVINDEGNPLFHITLLHHNSECFSKFWGSLTEQHRLLAINMKNNNGNNLLHYAIMLSSRLKNEAEIFLLLWNCLSEQEKLAALQEKNNSNETLLFLAAKHQFKIFKVLWESLAPDNQVIELFRKNKEGDTLLHCAINQEAIFLQLWQSLADEEKHKALKEKNNKNETLLYLSRTKPNLFKILWNFLSEQERLAVQGMIDKEGMTLVHWALKNNDTKMFFSLWQNITPKERLAAALEKTASGKSLLHLAVDNNCTLEVFHTILKDLSEAGRLIAIQQKDNQGKTPVHLAAHDNKHNSLFYMLDCLSEPDKSVVLREKFNGNTVFHQINSPAIARAILCLSQEDRLALVLENSKEGKNLIHHAIQQNSEIFYIVWKSLSTQARAIVKQSKAVNGAGLLQLAAQKSTPDAWQIVWDSYTDEERRVLIKEKTGSEHSTLLHWALQNTIQNPLHTLVAFLGADLWAALLEQDTSGNAPLHLILKQTNPHTLGFIFNFLTSQQRLAILKIKDQFGNSLLHLAAEQQDPEIVRILLASLPAEDCLTFFLEKNQFGNTALHHAVQNSNPKLWFTMMEYLPEKDRLHAATDLSFCGYTPLQKASENSNPEILFGILRLYPESEQVEAINRLEAWWRRNGLEGNHRDLLNEQFLDPANNFNQRQLSPNLAKVSKLGIFSQSTLSQPNENPLTPLQASLLEQFVGFNN